MIKRLGNVSISQTGDPTVFPVEDQYFSKTASSIDPVLLQYLLTAPVPKEDIARTVIVALSAFDAFGANRNGDAFLEEHILRNNDYQLPSGENISVPMHESFQHFAKPFRHHINREDSPFYGHVLKSFYNRPMRRVELVVDWDRSRAPDLVEKFERYEPVGTSMGFRCSPGDICSICGNLARSRREYCSCLLNEMLRVRPDGRLVCAINHKGKFFDISAVDDPADRTSRAVYFRSLPGLSPAERAEEAAEAEVEVKVASAIQASMTKGASVQPMSLNDLTRDFSAVSHLAEDIFEKEAFIGVAGRMLTGVATRVGSRMGALRGMGQRLMSSGAGTAARQAPRAQGIVAKAFKPTKSPGFITSSFAGETASRIGDSVTKTAYNKQADILKRIQANIQMSPSDVERYRRVADQARSAKRMSKNAMLALAPYGIEQIANVCVATGVNLAPEEIQFLVLAGEGEQKTAEILYDNNWVIEPQCVDTSEQMWLDPTSVNSALYNQVASAQAFMDMRSDNLPHAASAQRFQMAKEAFYGMNPRVYRRPAPAPIMHLPKSVSRKAVAKAAFIMGIIAAAKVLLTPGTPKGEVVAITTGLVGATAIAGFAAGKDSVKHNMILTDRQRARNTELANYIHQQSANMSPTNIRSAIQGQVAYDALFGATKTAGLLSLAALNGDPEILAERGIDILNSLSSLSKVGSALDSETAAMYGETADISIPSYLLSVTDS